jgi:hypothetical protein
VRDREVYARIFGLVGNWDCLSFSRMKGIKEASQWIDWVGHDHISVRQSIAVSIYEAAHLAFGRPF